VGSRFDSDSDSRYSVQTLIVHTRITTHIKPTIASHANLFSEHHII